MEQAEINPPKAMNESATKNPLAGNDLPAFQLTLIEFTRHHFKDDPLAAEWHKLHEGEEGGPQLGIIVWKKSPADWLEKEPGISREFAKAIVARLQQEGIYVPRPQRDPSCATHGSPYAHLY